MRTTIRLDDELHRQAKMAAAASGLSLSQLVGDTLRLSLRRRQSAATRERISLPAYKGGKLLSGANLDNSAELLDVMESTTEP